MLKISQGLFFDGFMVGFHGKHVKKVENGKHMEKIRTRSRLKPPLSDRSYGVSMIDFKQMSIRSIFVGHIADILFGSLILVNFENIDLRHQAKPRRWPFLGIWLLFGSFLVKILTLASGEA